MMVKSRLFRLLAVGPGVLSALLFVLSNAQAEFDRGQALYENHCKSCHEDWAHTRDGSRIFNQSELRNRVAAWSIHSGLGWSDEEIDDVTRFLNQQYYNFTDKP